MGLLKVTFYKLKMMLSDKLFLAAMILIPLFITIAAGYSLRYEKLGVIPVVFADEDKSMYSETLIQKLMEKKGLKISVASRQEALDILHGNGAEAVFIIKDNFEKSIISGEPEGVIQFVKAPSSFSADYIREIVAGEVMRFITSNMAADWVENQYSKLGFDTGEDLRRQVIEYTGEQLDNGPALPVEYHETGDNGTLKVKSVSMPAATATSAGIITVFIMFYILFGSGWLIEERLNGTLKRLQSAPGAIGLSYLGNVLALFAAGIIQVIFFSAIDRFLGVRLLPGPLAYAVISSYLLSVISISLLLSALLKSPAQLQAGAPAAALLSGFAGGCFWNFIDMPANLKTLALFTPQGWALKGINSLILNPLGTAEAIVPILVLLSISAVLLPAGYIIIRVQMDK